jgi:hypothetical protein
LCPSNVKLRLWYVELGHWLPVAIRTLKRRRSAAGAGGGVSQVSIPGAIGVTIAKPDVASLDAQIARLEAAWAEEQGLPTGATASSSRLCRVTPR